MTGGVHAVWKSWHSMTGTGENLIIRPAYPEDAAAFLETLEEVCQEGIYFLEDHAVRSVPEQEKMIRHLDRSRNLIAVAVLNSRIVGGIAVFAGGMSQKSRNFCTLGIHVIKEARTMGIGSALLAYGMDWAKERNYHKLCLSVFSTNVRAISLYRKMGFLVEGCRKEQFYFRNRWVDEVLMAKFLQK